MFARIENSVVVEVCDTNPYIPFPADKASQFTVAPDDVEVGWRMVDGELHAPDWGWLQVSPRQIAQALTRVGLRDAVEAAVAAGDQDLKDWWNKATYFDRNEPLVDVMGAALGKSPAEVDHVFKVASTL